MAGIYSIWVCILIAYEKSDHIMSE